MNGFSGKVAAITGAGSGIGRGLALELAKAGAQLALADIQSSTLEETARMASERGARVTTRVLDVADRVGVYAWADAVVADHGRCNLIFNNAGVAVGATLEGVSDEDFEWIMNINFWGVVHGSRAFLPHLRASGDGHVINVSSVFGLFPVPGQGTYNASKFAVRGFSEALRQELELMNAPVRVTTVYPGGIKTNIAKSSRFSGSLSMISSRSPEEMRRNFERLFITEPDKAARIILRAVSRNKRRVLVGSDAVLLDVLVRWVPTSFHRATLAAARRAARS